MSRVKTQKLETIEDFNARCDRVAEIEIQIKAAEAQRDGVIASVEKNYNPDIDKLKLEQEKLVAEAEIYATKNRKILLPGKRKSGKSPVAIFGFRSSTKLLCKRSEEVVAKEMHKLCNLLKYLKIEPKLDKKLIQSTFTPTEDGKDKSSSPYINANFRIDKNDTFYIQPKPELAEPNAKKGASK